MDPRELVDADAAPYWDGARRHELVLLRCEACGTWVHYPRPRCPRCLSKDVRPHAASGRGVVYSYTVAHPRANEAGAQPTVLVMVDLDEQEGLRVVAGLDGVAPGDVRIGLPVEVAFDDRDGWSLPRFRPRAGPPTAPR